MPQHRCAGTLALEVEEARPQPHSPPHSPTPPPSEVPKVLQDRLRARGLSAEDVDVQVEDHRGEEWKAPPYRAFSGAGAATGAARAAPASAIVGGGAGAAVQPPTLQAGAPTTVLAVRLLDGRRERVTLNTSHTVAQLQAAVAALNGAGGRPFVLVAGFPPRPLADSAASIEAAGLKGAAIQQQAA